MTMSLKKIVLLSMTAILILSVQPASAASLQIPTDEGQLNISLPATDYTTSQTPAISLSTGRSSGLSGVVQTLHSAISNKAPQIAVSVSRPNSSPVYQETLDFDHPPQTLSINPQNLIPGKYTAAFTYEGQTFTQDFTWGVLAINTHKSIYKPKEMANIAIAVLDDLGQMVCNADVTLTILDPNGNSTRLSTSDRTITVQDACRNKSYTLEPDYKSFFTTSSAGLYQMTLTAVTQNGSRSITDQFEVRTQVPFDIERITATRLFPSNNYPVLLKITAHESYQGIITEPISVDLQADYLDSSQLKNDFSLDADLTSGLIKSLPIKTDDKYHTLSWQVDWKKGGHYYLGYYFDPPEISPQFYTLGPLTIDTFREVRLWHLANDASGDVILLWDTANGSIPAGWTCISCTGGDAYYGVMPRGAASYSASTAGSDSHSHTYTYSSATQGATDNSTKGESGTSTAQDSHTHTWGNPSAGSGSVLPPYKNLNFIYANSPSVIPANVIGIFDTTTLPGDWTRYSALDSNYLRGYSDNTAAGSSTHSHTTGAVTSGSSGTQVSDTGSTNNAANSHTHTISASNTSNATNQPPYVNVVFAYNGSGGDIFLPDGLIAFFNATPPAGWTSVSDSSPYNGNFLVGASSSIGTTGGSSADHNHTGSMNLASGTNSSSTASSQGGSGTLSSASDSHTHTVTYTVDSQASLPVYRDTIIAKLSSTFDALSGNVYSDEGTTAIQPTGVCAVINNGTPSCDTSIDVSGAFSITDLNASAGDQITLFIDGGTDFGNTVTVSGGSHITNFKIYENHVIVRDDNGGTISIAEMDAYDNDQNSTDILFDAEDSTTDTLLVEDGNELYVPTGEIFEPGGNLDDGAGAGIDDIKIVGTYTASGSESILVSGSWACSGTYTTSTSTVTLDAASGTETITSSCAFNNLTLNDGGGSATFQLEANLDTNGNLTITGGTLDVKSGSNYSVTVGGTLTNNDTFTTRTGIVTLDGTSGAIAGTTNTTFNSLTIDPASTGTVTLSSSDPTVNDTLTVASGDTLSLSSSRTLTLGSGSTFTLSGTVSGLGKITYTSGNNFPTTGTLSVPITFDTTNGNLVISNRTYGGAVELYTNSSSTSRTVTFGTAASQTITFSDNLSLNAANIQNLVIDGGTYNPAVNITGNLDFTGTSDGSESVTSGTGIWTVSGNIDFTGGTYTASTGNTVRMNGSSKTITSASHTLQNFEVSGGSVSNVDALDVNGTFAVSSGTFTQGANVNLNVAGNFTLSSGITFTKASGTGNLYLDGDLTFTDSTAVKQDLGNVSIGASPDTTNLASDFAATSLTVISADYFYTNGYDLDIGTGGITINGTFDATDDVETDTTQINCAGSFAINSGASFVYSDSTLIMDGPSGTSDLITDGSFSLYNLTLNDAGGSLTVEVEDPLVVLNALTITGGTLDTTSGENNQITIGGNFTNGDTFTPRSGTVIFNDSSKSSTLSYSAATTFYNLSVSTGGKQVYFDDTYQTNVTGAFTVQGTDCTTGLILLDSETNDNQWDIYVSGTHDIDYADIEDANAVTTALTTNNSTAVNNNNTNFTVSGGACISSLPVFKGGATIKGGVTIK